MLNQSSSTGPVYTLIPLAAILFFSWLLKNKVYQFDFAKHLQTVQSTEDTDEQTDTMIWIMIIFRSRADTWM